MDLINLLEEIAGFSLPAEWYWLNYVIIYAIITGVLTGIFIMISSPFRNFR